MVDPEAKIPVFRGSTAFMTDKNEIIPSPAATLICPSGCEIVQLPTPILSSEGLYAFDTARHPYLYVRRLFRDRIYADLFHRLQAHE